MGVCAKAAVNISLLPLEALVRTSRVDHADWNYRPFLALVMRRRFALALALLRGKNLNRVLEVGFGSGIFMPELARRYPHVYGIDVHEQVALVQERLRERNLNAVLSRQDASDTNFPDGFFDGIVSVSAIEFIENIESAAREFFRVLSPNGCMIAVMPGKSPVLDFLLHVSTGEDAQSDYGDRRERVLPVMLEYFSIVRKRRFHPVYTAYEFIRRG